MKEEKSFCLKALFLALMKIWKEKKTCTLKKYKHQQNALLCTCESVLSFFICYVLLWDIIVFTQKYALGNYYVNESLSMGQSSTCTAVHVCVTTYTLCFTSVVISCLCMCANGLNQQLCLFALQWPECFEMKLSSIRWIYMDLLWRLTYLLSLFLFSVVW